MTASPVVAYIGIGSNLGAAQDNVRRAILHLEKLPGTRLGEVSSLFRTAPVDAGGDDYINAVAQIETQLSAPQLLESLQAIEADFGRERPYRNAPRSLDLDILLYGRQQVASASLTVPHPRLTERAFALIPLLQIEPLIAIPGKGPAHGYVSAVAGQSIRKI